MLYTFLVYFQLTITHPAILSVDGVYPYTFSAPTANGDKNWEQY